MISVSEAEERVLGAVGRLPAEHCKLKAVAGRVLRGPIKADRDGPPFDRSTLDGVCLRMADWAAGRRELSVHGVQAAGAPSAEPPPEGGCMEIMTGAAIPAPCDVILPVEDFAREGDVVHANPGAALQSGQGMHRRGSDFRAGDVLVEPGCRMSARHIAVAASCGRTDLEVAVEPKIAILSTGDELVDVEDEPKPHQIRRSNDVALKAVLEARGYRNIEMNHLPDNAQAISWNLERLLQQADVILVTGGVSKGRFDHLPAVLTDLGVKQHFHGVAQRPGKPMFFGTFERPGDFLHPEDTRVVAVFALPGNPVSAFTCAHRYVLGAIDRMSGVEPARAVEFAVLGRVVSRHARLTLFVPVRIEPAANGQLRAEPRQINTSGDYAAVAGTDGYVEIAPGDGDLGTGTAVPLRRWS